MYWLNYIVLGISSNFIFVVVVIRNFWDLKFSIKKLSKFTNQKKIQKIVFTIDTYTKYYLKKTTTIGGRREELLGYMQDMAGYM